MLSFAFHYEYKDGTSTFSEYLLDHSTTAWLMALDTMRNVRDIKRVVVTDENGLQVTDLTNFYSEQGV